MANKEIKIDVKLNLEGGESSLNSIKAIKDEISKLESEASNLTFGSEAFEDAKDKLDDLKDKLNQFSKSRSQLNKEMVDKQLAAEKSISDAIESHAKERQEKMMQLGDNVEKLAMGMTDAFVGFSLAMGASEEDADKFNQKMASAIGIATGLKGAIEGSIAAVQLAGPAFKALNTIIAANPIGAAVVAIAALTAGIAALTQENKAYIAPAESVFESMNRTTQSANDLKDSIAELAIAQKLASGQMTEAQAEEARTQLNTHQQIRTNTEEHLKNIQAIEKQYGFKAQLLRKTFNYQEMKEYDSWDEEKRRKFDEAKKGLLKLEEEYAKQNLNIYQTNQAKLQQKKEEDRKKEEDSKKKQELSDDEKRKRGLESLIEYSQQLAVMQAANNKFMAEEGLKLEAEITSDGYAIMDGLAKQATSSATETAQEIARVRMAIFYQNMREISAEVNKYTQAIGSTLNSVMGVFQAISDMRNQDIEQETRERKAALDQQLSDLDYARELELSKEGLSAEQKTAIEDAYAQRKYELELDTYNRETELKKKAFETDKKLKIAQTIISTISGAVAAFTGMVASIPGPVGLVLGTVAAAAVTAMGAIQIATIQKQKFDAGTPPQAPRPSISQVGGGQGGNQGEAMGGPSLRRIGRSSVSDVSEIENGRQGYYDGPIKAYVVSGDITSSQNKEAVIRRRSSF